MTDIAQIRLEIHVPLEGNRYTLSSIERTFCIVKSELIDVVHHGSIHTSVIQHSIKNLILKTVCI